jgi:hypothetical protein
MDGRSHADRGSIRAEGDRGQVRIMRFGRMLSETRLAKSHTDVPRCEANRSNPVGLALPPDPRNPQNIQRLQRCVMFSKRFSLIGLSMLFGCGSTAPEFDCQFEKMTDHYQVTRTELEGIDFSRSPVLIEVTRDGRTFMFRRDRIIACRLIQ